MDVPVPDGVCGKWRVETFTVSEQGAKMANIRACFGRPHEYILPGTYKRLMRGGTVVMSNTPMEIRTHAPIMHHAAGHVHLNGLGLGMVLHALLQKPGVDRVTVVEISPDVLTLVGPTFAGDPRVELVQGDALRYSPPKGTRYGACWHDIFDEICTDNLDLMTCLKCKYGRWSDWQGCWSEEILRDRVRQERRYHGRW